MKRILLAVLLCGFTLAVSASAAEFSADMSTGMAGMNMPGKIYYKDTKTSRTEMNMGMMNIIVITKNPNSYQLFPSTKKYVVTNIEEMKKQNPMADVDNFDEWLKKNNFKKTGTETIQGFECAVYEGIVATQSTEAGVPATIPTKLWYSAKLAYPIKSEMEMGNMGKMTYTLENISLGSQPASLFDLPSGYTQAKDAQEAMGMGNMGAASGGSDQAPTQEQIDEAMKQAQEMMKNAPQK